MILVSCYSCKKGKKEISVYICGLLKIKFVEVIIDVDYSGWMKKKSLNFMIMWKFCFFVFKGCWLVYYYLDDDD